MLSVSYNVGIYIQGVSIHYITSIHYISEDVVVVVHYIFWTISVVVANTFDFENHYTTTSVFDKN